MDALLCWNSACFARRGPRPTKGHGACIVLHSSRRSAARLNVVHPARQQVLHSMPQGEERRPPAPPPERNPRALERPLRPPEPEHVLEDRRVSRHDVRRQEEAERPVDCVVQRDPVPAVAERRELRAHLSVGGDPRQGGRGDLRGRGVERRRRRRRGLGALVRSEADADVAEERTLRRR